MVILKKYVKPFSKLRKLPANVGDFCKQTLPRKLKLGTIMKVNNTYLRPCLISAHELQMFKSYIFLKLIFFLRFQPLKLLYSYCYVLFLLGYKIQFWVSKEINWFCGYLVFWIFTLPYRVWSSIVIVHEKSGFFSFFFSKYLKNGWYYFDKKKIGQNHSISVYKRALISEHRKNYIFRDNNSFVKMSVSLLVC